MRRYLNTPWFNTAVLRVRHVGISLQLTRQGYATLARSRSRTGGIQLPGIASSSRRAIVAVVARRFILEVL